MVTGVNQRQHITPPALTYIHWLPYPSRLVLSSLQDCHVNIQDTQKNRPAYLADLIEPITNSSRSATRHCLQVTYSPTSFAHRAFIHPSTTIWNSLRPNLTSKLTTYFHASSENLLQPVWLHIACDHLCLRFNSYLSPEKRESWT